MAINQCGGSAERRLAFVDINGECFVALINTYGATRRCEKIGKFLEKLYVQQGFFNLPKSFVFSLSFLILGAMISNIHFNNNTNMLAAFRERKVVVWSLPSVVFTDRELLNKTTIELEAEDMGKSAFIVG